MASTVTRRSFAKGAAWATPIVAATAAIPAYAASQTCPTVSNYIATSTAAGFEYTHGNMKGATFNINGQGNNGQQVTITAVSGANAADWRVEADRLSATYIGSETVAAGETRAALFTIENTNDYSYNSTLAIPNAGNGCFFEMDYTTATNSSSSVAQPGVAAPSATAEANG